MSSALPEGWEETNIGKYLIVLTDYTANGSFESLKKNVTYYNSTNYAVLVRTTDLEKLIFKPERFTDKTGFDFLIKSKLESGDIVIANVGSAGKAYRIPYYHLPMTLAPNMYLTKFDESELNKNYIFQVLIWENTINHFKNSVASSTLSAINKTSFRGIPLNKPPLPEQEKIAAVLGSVDDVIEKTSAQIEKLQDLKKATMNELLTKGIGHTQFKQSELGTIPESWEVKTINEVCKVGSGGTPDRKIAEYWNGNIPWIKTGEINYNIIMQTSEHITELGLNSSSTKLFDVGSIVMAMYGQGTTRGKVALLGVSAATNQACAVFQCGNIIFNIFLFYFFSSNYDFLRSLVQEGTQKNLNAAILKDIFIPVPPLHEQKQIAQILDSISNQISAVENKLKSLMSIKKSLMQDLLTGKVRVKVS